MMRRFLENDTTGAWGKGIEKRPIGSEEIDPNGVPRKRDSDADVARKTTNEDRGRPTAA